MRNLIVLTIALLLVIPMAVQADEPPAHGNYLAGWGMNPNNWNAVSGSYNSGLALYDHDAGLGGGGNWVVGYDGNYSPQYIVYDPITLELWIEMHMIQTYRYTSYQWHRIGNASEQICAVIEGTVQSNNGQWVSLIKGTQDLDHLWFIHDARNRTGSYGRDIPIAWQGRWGRGLVYGEEIQQDWFSITPGPDIDMLIPEVCDHWFQFQGCFDLLYHEEDGYYSLTLAGCPAPTM